MSETTIEDLPDEILEYIFHLLPPYEDVKNCRSVSRKWNQVARSIISRVKQSFGDAINSHNVTIEFQPSKKNSITKRYAHSACRYRDSMYIFGGFTSSFSSFNDLWKLDLSTRAWTRISVQGKWPMPKAGATMVTYESKLVLFGGMLPHMQGASNQRRLSNHIHTFHTMTNTWSEITYAENIVIPGLARHSATVHNHKMVIFGGLEKLCCVNNVYTLDLRTMDWQYVIIHGEKPAPRFGQSQVFIDDTHLLILGGLNTDSVIFDDVWLLDMSSSSWCWSKVDLGAHVMLTRAVWCHPVCKVGKYIVVFKPTTNNPAMYTDWFPIPTTRYSNSISPGRPEEVNLNGKRGRFGRFPNCEVDSNKEKLPKKLVLSNIREFKPLNSFKTSVELHMLDISNLLEDNRLIHVRGKLRPLNCPSDTILYSVIEGNGELILFGGIQRNIVYYDDGSQEIATEIMNTLKIIKLKKKIV